MLNFLATMLLAGIPGPCDFDYPAYGGENLPMVSGINADASLQSVFDGRLTTSNRGVGWMWEADASGPFQGIGLPLNFVEHVVGSIAVYDERPGVLGDGGVLLGYASVENFPCNPEGAIGLYPYWDFYLLDRDVMLTQGEDYFLAVMLRDIRLNVTPEPAAEDLPSYILTSLGQWKQATMEDDWGSIMSPVFKFHAGPIDEPPLVPEPSTYALLVAGLVSAPLWFRRRRRAA